MKRRVKEAAKVRPLNRERENFVETDAEETLQRRRERKKPKQSSYMTSLWKEGESEFDGELPK